MINAIACSLSKGLNMIKILCASLLTSVLYYREMASRRLLAFWSWLLQMVYLLNPYALWKSDDFWKRCVLWYCAIRVRFNMEVVERDKLLEWASSKIVGVPKPTNFTSSWKDGVALCALMEDLSPGSCPRFDLLNPEHCQSNVHLALKMVQKNLKMKPTITVKEMVEASPATERKLVCLLTQLKMTASRPGPKKRTSMIDGLPSIRTPGDGERSYGGDQECVAKGMGLMLAVKGRKATFNIYLKTSTNLNIVIEIKGPHKSIVSERITSRSPKKKTPIKQGTPVLEGSMLGNRAGRRSFSTSSVSDGQEGENSPIKIPFEYEVQRDKIAVGYIPQENGKHRLSIIWEGQHIMGSPYSIRVDDSMDRAGESTKAKTTKRFLLPHQRSDSIENDTPPPTPRVNTPSPPPPQDTETRGITFPVPSIYTGSRKLGAVTRRRVLRHILSIDGKEVVVEDADAEHLGMAVQALKEVELEEKEANKKKMTRQSSMDIRRRDSFDYAYQQTLCPVNEDMDLKEIRSLSPKREVDCGPIFSDGRPRAVSYTESEISSIDGLDTTGSVNQEAFKWDEILDGNRHSEQRKKLATIPSFEITHDLGDPEDPSEINDSVESETRTLLDVNASDDADSITPELAHGYFLGREPEPEPELEMTLNELEGDIPSQTDRNGSFGGSESDEWLVVSMDAKTQEHSVEISNQRARSPNAENEENSTPQNENEEPVDEPPLINFDQVDHGDTEEEFHSLEERSHDENHGNPIEKPVDNFIDNPVENLIDNFIDNPIENLIDTPDVNPTENLIENVRQETEMAESVTNRKQFFENLLQSHSQKSSPLQSPVKSPPKASPSNRLFNPSYSVDESIHLKRNSYQEQSIPAKSQSLCSLSDDGVDTSPAFLKARSFWESGHSSPDANVESIPPVVNKRKSPTEEMGTSIRQKLTFWQTLTTTTTTTAPTSPSHETPTHDNLTDRLTDELNEDDDTGKFKNNKDTRKMKKNDTRLGSPGSQGTLDSGVFILGSKLTLNSETGVIVKGGDLERTLSDPGTRAEDDYSLNLTTMATKSFVYKHNPIFSLDSESLMGSFNTDFDELTSSGHNETMSDDRGYIDDEIPDYASLMMDRYISFTGLLDNDRLLSRNELVGMGIEGIIGHCYGGDAPLKDADKALLPKAGMCRAYGAGVYYGQVGIRNQFQVCTEGAGKGCLTVSVQGPGEHDVAEVVISYMGQHSYDIMYEVLEPGYYIISVKWSEWNIPESPFICKVTY